LTLGVPDVDIPGKAEKSATKPNSETTRRDEAVWKSHPVRTIRGRYLEGIAAKPVLRHLSM